MTDLAKLRELRQALTAMDKATTPEGVYGAQYEAVLAAARAYADLLENGQRVGWCSSHHCDAVPRLGRDSFTCWKAEFTKHLDPKSCRIVSKLLIEVPE